MGDEKVGHPLTRLKVQQKPEDAIGDQRVKRAGHLVADDQLWFRRQCPRDADALFLAARKLGRVAVGVAAAHLDFIQQLLHAAVTFGAAQAKVELQRAPDEGGNRLARVHGDIGHLVDHLQFAQVVLGASGKIG